MEENIINQWTERIERTVIWAESGKDIIDSRIELLKLVRQVSSEKSKLLNMT